MSNEISYDILESARRQEQAKTNALADDKIPADHWTTETLQRDFEVLSFLAPFVVVRRKSDGVRGSLRFKHEPRRYWDFKPE